MNCPHCHTHLASDTAFCHQCGQKVTQDAVACDTAKAAKPGLDIIWVFKSAGIMVLTFIGVCVVLGLFLGALSVDHSELELESALENEELLILVVAGMAYIFTLFLGALLAAFFSPGTTIKEPAIAAALLVTVGNILYANLITVIVGAIIPYFVALAGAKLGEKMQTARNG
jgi:hypothetical protein